MITTELQLWMYCMVVVGATIFSSKFTTKTYMDSGLKNRKTQGLKLLFLCKKLYFLCLKIVIYLDLVLLLKYLLVSNQITRNHLSPPPFKKS